MKQKIINNLPLIISGVLTAVICLVMNLFLIPAIESGTQGIRCFDMNFAYSFEDAVRFLSLISDEGRDVYLKIQLPLDFIYPVAYAVFFILLIKKLLNKKSFLLALPAVLAVSDYIENICTVKMLKSSELKAGFVEFASAVTVIKTLLMYFCFLIIAVLIICYIIIKIKNDNKNKEVS